MRSTVLVPPSFLLRQFNQHRSKYSLLLAHAVPKEGGDTDFADTRRAYNDLPDEKKRELQDLIIESE